MARCPHYRRFRRDLQQILQALKSLPVETQRVMARTAETELKVADVRRLADVAYRIDNLAGAVSSGSFRTLGMVVAPCSIRRLCEIAHGITSNLLTRAADVVLRERRKLVLVARETTLYAIHRVLDLFDLDTGKVKPWS